MSKQDIITTIREMRSEGFTDSKIREIINFMVCVKLNGYIKSEIMDECFAEA